MGFKTHAIIEIDSRTKTSGSIDNFDVILRNPIILNRNRQYFMRVENVRLPTSFYNTNSNNNILKITEDPSGTADDVTVTIPEGNYNESELRTTIIALLNAATANSNTYNITVDDVTGKFTFTTDITEFRIESITGGSTINRQIGFLDNTYTSSSMSLTSVAHISLNSRRFLTLDTGLASNNLYNKDHLKNIALHIPITEARSTVQFYNNHEGYKAKLENFHSIKHLRMRIVDADNNSVDFNGVDWSCEVVIYEFRD